MPDFFDDEPRQQGPDELCQQAFSRCSNWPTERAGQIGLAQGLKLAADRYHVGQEEIIERCRQVSAFCPTDFDILRVAGELAKERERRKAEPAPWLRPPKCATCGDTGWKPSTRGGYDAAERCPVGCEVPDRQRFGGVA